MSVTIQLDTSEFNRALREYMKVSKRDMAYVLNKKALYIARGAARLTYKASQADIDEALQKLVYVEKESARPKQAPMIGVIVEKQDKAKLGKGYSPTVPAQLEEFKKRIKRFISRKHSARAFMAGAWKPAIKEFAAKIGEPPRDEFLKRDRKRSGFDWNKFGGALKAIPGEKLMALLWNGGITPENPKTGYKPDSADERNLARHAGGALQSAMDTETRSMDGEVAKRLQAEADRRAAKFMR